ncbi:MAG: cysteine-rich CWC family protein [Leptospiraceae bacterium]|nr:cysteine-rich CWC family protein [Leptospiraceae bacterium]MDW8306207.1 cysteine-rich CWC family protein [Leptospiraceae bacterium]
MPAKANYLWGDGKHEELICPRCGRNFVCKRGDIANCQCSSVHLMPQTLKFLQKTYYGCLCVFCLLELNELVRQSLEEDFPLNPQHLREGVHFYIEGGKLVFTEYYHILRGYCCGSLCRHCAYGYKGKKV